MDELLGILNKFLEGMPSYCRSDNMKQGSQERKCMVGKHDRF